MIGRMRGAGVRRAGLVAVVCATLILHGRMDTASAAASGTLRVPDPERARALALGFEPVVADYHWIQAVQLAGGRRDPSKAHGEVLGDLIEVVTTLDPWVDHPYRFAALWLTAEPGHVRRANALLEKGIAYHPREWRNRFYLGYNHFFHLGDNDRAADVLETAVHLDGAPDYLGALVTRLRASSDGLETALLFLQNLIRNAPDESARAAYRGVFDEIETERRARLLDRARTVFWDRHGRDIRTPRELWAGPLRVLSRRPPPHPSGAGAWRIDDESGEIVSSYYGARYRVHSHPHDVERRERWRARMAAAGPEADATGEDTGRGDRVDVTGERG